MALLGKEKIIPQRSEVWAHFTKIINSEGARQLVLPRKGVQRRNGIFQLGDLIKKHVGKG
ncbi:hypothetical protein Godav_020973 [Gossypium davidsonii]|uniref:Uncharacterized protein n=1 Tax=Gossypium davidsonii TaxID=34287 RepID=A0A7J8R5F8_GOSDV|nr:hypothetical protein [Gossypium davidsonii]